MELPGLSFVYPEMLALLGLIPALWFLALNVPRRLSPLRFGFSLVLRSTLIAALVLALAGTQLQLPVQQMTTVFLVDGSDSVGSSARAQADAFIKEALLNKPADDRAAVVVFGENALVDRAPMLSRMFSKVNADPIATRTDIAEAVQLALALFPADSQKRIVLLSDGGANEGDTLAAAQLAAARGIPIDIVDLSANGGEVEAMVTGLAAPGRARNGQELSLVAIVQSTIAQRARLRLFADDQMLDERSVELISGTNEVTFQVTADGAGFRQYRVDVAAAEDGQAENNSVAALVQVEGEPRVLLIASRAEDANALVAALSATTIKAEVLAPADAPADLAGLMAYEAVVLVNVPARSLPVGTMAALPGYVRDLGKGLVMIGGAESYGVGGYGRTPVEEALPVYMEVRDKEERPDLGLVFVIDKSGSMDACHCNSDDRRAPITGLAGRGRKIDIAKEAVAQAAALLTEEDTLGVIGFDRVASEIFPPTENVGLQQLATAMASVEPRGTTNVRSGLRAAEEMLDTIDARIKHVVLLTDGWGSGGVPTDIAARLRDKGVTLSVVAAGGGSADYLEELAELGNGRYYPVNDMADVPQIFVQETITVVGNYLIEREVVPLAVAGSAVLDGLPALPPLYGFNGRTIKETARLALFTDDEQPLLTTWQYGLGRSAAWLSDASPKWASQWVNWPGFPRFASQLIGAVLPAVGGAQLTTEVTISGSSAEVRLSTGAASPLEGATVVTATLFIGDGSQSEVALHQVEPGIYSGELPSPAPGTYLVQVAGSAGDQLLAQQIAGLVVPYSPEYGPNSTNSELLRQLASFSGGVALDNSEQAFAPTSEVVSVPLEIGLPLLIVFLVLLPLDILVRRISVRVR
jgi:Mg-chelatase subunit ChlD